MAIPTDTPNPATSQTLQKALEVASTRHKHLCPRQVLGARCAIAAATMLELEVPRTDKRLLVIVETDGCFVDGVEAVAGVAVGRRTLRVEDYGKMAATFVDVKTERALRVAPQVDVRERARDYAPEQTRRYFAMLPWLPAHAGRRIALIRVGRAGQAGRRHRQPGRGACQSVMQLWRRDYQRARGGGGWTRAVPVLRGWRVLFGGPAAISDFALLLTPATKLSSVLLAITQAPGQLHQIRKTS